MSSPPHAQTQRPPFEDFLGTVLHLSRDPNQCVDVVLRDPNQYMNADVSRS